jgi:threonylcarbamoyladenosine tRNA methylthiotransferase CDKAL1
VERAKQAFQEGVVELWLTSEDLGAYGHDISVTLPELLWQLVRVVPEGCMVRLGMTNPPYIMDHMTEMAAILRHPRVYSFLHIPVQCGSDSVLSEMRREYTTSDFTSLVDYLKEHVPDITIATDIICGFPTETEEDFEGTMQLVQHYQFPSLFINQFYPRPGTPAARMRRIPTHEVKARSRKLSRLFQSYQPYSHLVGTRCSVLVTEVSSDGRFFVGHDKPYRQVLVPREDGLMGRMVQVLITSAGKHYVLGELLQEPLVELASHTLPSTPAAVSMTTCPLPDMMDTKTSSHNVWGQGSLDRVLLAIVVCIVCWLLAQHSHQLISS